MKSRNKKECKGKESTIGKIIYGFLLFMPLLAIAVTCAYVIFNKNAYQSYEGYNKQSTSTLATSIQSGLDYSIITNSTIANNTGTDNQIEVSNLSFFTSDNGYQNTFNTNKDNIKYIQLRGNYNPSRLYLFDDTNTQITYFTTNVTMTFNFTALSNSGITNNNYFYLITQQQTGNSLSNVFYYSIEKVEQSPLFSWAKDSVIYTGMNNTCNALSITNTFVPLMMTYWLIISVIYFLYDIILIILHVFHRKIHELEESI